MKSLHLVAVLLFSFGLLLTADHSQSYAKSETKETVAAVEKKVDTQKSSIAKKSAKPLPGSIGLNSADKDTLVQLPGVGPKTADAIIEYRSTNGKFKSVDDLVNVKGIGKKSLEKLKLYLKV
jgi:competence protein ComEA